MTGEIYCYVFLENELTGFLAPLMCFILTGFPNSTKIFPQIFKIRFLSNSHNVSLTFFLLANKHQTSYEDVFTHTASEAAKLLFQQLFC
jgi:hypothetical protein